MGINVIESEVWENNQALSIFIFISCLLSIICLPQNSSTRISTVFDQSLPSSFFRFQRYFLLIFCLSSVMEGMWSVFGEYQMAYFGVSKEKMVSSLIIGSASSLFLGISLGILSDIIGRKKVCLMFCILHLCVAVLKMLFSHPSIWVASVCLSLATSIFLFGFETWMVVEHDKLGHRLDSLNEMFWLMTFFESASLITSQVLANWLVNNDIQKTVVSPTVSALVPIVSIIFIKREWREYPSATFKEYRIALNTHIFFDKRTWLLGWAQSCVHFSVATFWILWAPTIVADGRAIRLGMIYPCLLGAKMLGSTMFPWFINGPLPLRTEDCLVYAFVIAGIVLSIVAYDYQEIGILVGLFCLFHACIGLVLPSLARLRTLYVPNELRGGMISLSLAPANAAILFCMIQRGYNESIENSTIIAFGAIGLFSAAGCMHLLKQSGKHSPHQNFHKQ